MVRLCVLLTIMSVAATSVFFCGDPFSRKAFEKELWVNSHKSEDPDNPRGLMVNDLKKNHLKIGMSRKDVIRLLGEPDIEKKVDFLSYYLGCWSGFRIDSDTLDLKFDTSGKLISIDVVNH